MPPRIEEQPPEAARTSNEGSVMNRSHVPILIVLFASGLLGFGCNGGGGSADHVSPCEETVVPNEPIVASYSLDDEEFPLDFDAAQVRLSYSDRPGDEACVFDAQVILSKGGGQGCTLTLETGPFLNTRDELLIQRVALSVTDACPTWGFTEPMSSEVTVSEGESWGFGSIVIPDLVDEDDSCYAGEVTVRLGFLELSVGQGSTEPTALNLPDASFFVDVEATPQSLPCAMEP
jgi:hypothetical protein